MSLLATVVQEAMERFAVPGVAVGLLTGHEEKVAGFGIASMENPLEVDGDTLFQVGSITKTFTAAAALRLAEAGQLALDEPVRTYLPDLSLADEAVAQTVTLRHLLTHVGGWAGDYFDWVSRGDDALATMVGRLNHLEQLTPLGKIWAYNNSGFYIAGRVIEVITGQPFEQALRQLVLEPLGMLRSFFFAEEVITHRFAVGHDRSGRVLREWDMGRAAAPVGGLITSIRELLKYAEAYWEPGRLLSAESLAELRRPHAYDVPLTDAFGLGWFLSTRNNHCFMTHPGSTNGQQALLVLEPTAKFALAVLTNHDDGSAVCSKIQAQALSDAFGLETGTEDGHSARPPGDLIAYAGTYEGQLMTARLNARGRTLVLEVRLADGFPRPESPPRPSPPPTRLAFEKQDVVVAVDPPLKGGRGDFVRGEENEIVWFRWHGRLLRRIH